MLINIVSNSNILNLKTNKKWIKMEQSRNFIMIFKTIYSYKFKLIVFVSHHISSGVDRITANRKSELILYFPQPYKSV